MSGEIIKVVTDRDEDQELSGVEFDIDFPIIDEYVGAYGDATKILAPGTVAIKVEEFDGWESAHLIFVGDGCYEVSRLNRGPWQEGDWLIFPVSRRS